MTLEKFTKEICKTGYVLEQSIASMLKADSWTVISNKYYEDDFTNSVREIDLLAYKVNKVLHLNVYTVLLISCKKNDSNTWALLSRDINLSDPNADWWPLHAWSNDKAIQFQLASAGSKKKFHEEIASLGVANALSVPSVEVFAFQEMATSNGAPKNDTNIFNAVTSLMKAQAYELGSLPHRKKSPSIYQFNLISVNDSDLIRLKFKGGNIIGEQITSEHYIARYIIKKSETFSRIRFIQASHFAEHLADYSKLHTANCKWFDKSYQNFFDGIIKDKGRISVLLPEFRSKIYWLIQAKTTLKLNKKIDVDDIFLNWDATKDILNIAIQLDDDLFFRFLNEDAYTKKLVSNALNDVYKFTGNFNFVPDLEIPF